MKPLYIELVENGVANRYDDGDYEVIEINWRLKNEPELLAKIIEHEKEHEEDNYKFKDLLHDMRSKTPGLLKFMRKNPSTWIQVLPIYWHKKRHKAVYDWNWITSWGILASVTYASFFLIDWGMYLLRRYTW